jgi:hypothetical protein
MCTLLAPEQLDRSYSYLVVKSLSIIRQYPVNVSISASKIGAHQMSLVTQNDYFLNSNFYGFDYISVIYGDHFPK